MGNILGTIDEIEKVAHPYIWRRTLGAPWAPRLALPPPVEYYMSSALYKLRESEDKSGLAYLDSELWSFE